MRKAIVFFVSAVVLFAAGSAWIALYPSVPADLGGVENFDPHALRVTIPVGESDQLEAWYVRGTRPATVILFPGYARDHRRMWRYAHFLLRDGYHVLAVDFRSARTLDRKPTTLGYWELRDARAVLDWLRARPESRGQRVAFFGESLGGAVGLALAAERPDVNAVVADCPFASGDAAIADGFRYVMHLPPYPLAQIARQLGKLMTGHDPGELDATAALRALNGRPVLLIQTTLEDRFSRAEVERLTSSAGLDAETWTVRDAKHTEVWVNHREEYETRVSRFLAPRLGGAVAPTAGASPAGDARPAAGAKPATTAPAASTPKKHGAP
jgi:pimeloyl-ACP methyl ester carboxylesterase